MKAEVAAPLAEVFVSLQGEGLWVGVSQIFVRVRGCELTCLYCDTAWAKQATGERVTLGDLLVTVEARVAQTPRLHSLALTGGEPLLYPEFARGLGEALEEWGLPLYLETAGHLPEALAQVIPVTRYVALDYKLPSTLAKPVAMERFLESVAVASERALCVKIVVTDHTPERELGEAACRLAEVNPRAPVVLQPVTGRSAAGGPPALEQLLVWQALFAERVEEVRVIPQCHKRMGVR